MGSRRFQDGGLALMTPASSVAASVRPGFVTVDEEADVMVGVVSYNSRGHLDALFASLREQATDLRIRVVVADNASADGSLERASAEPGVLAFSTGGNLGYAAAINEISHRWRNDCPLLVLNPDLVVAPGSVKAMLARLTGKIGVVVPLLLNEDGSVHHSLRHEPALLGAAGDAVFGSHFQARGHRLSETNFRPECYRYAHAVDWATGAALLISPAVAERVGEWDDRFFLYSEETDFLRRVRAAGWGVWFEPQAAMTHRGGGSGSSSELTALMVVNKLRYAEKHHSRCWSIPFRALLVAGACARAGDHGQRAALTMLLSRRRWPALPHATTPVVEATPTDVPRGAIVIPAHNEEKVIARLLSRLSGLAESGRVQIVVACNGCTDDTAGIALSFPGVTVVKIDESSKTAALNAAERAVDQFPRLYVDADVEISPSTVGSVFRHLEAGASEAARPVASYDVSASSRLVRCYFRARRQANVGSQALWGAGVYALSETGRSRFGRFPDVVADDLFIDSLFTTSEKAVIDGPAVIVRVPRDAKTLLSVLGRTVRGSAELRSTGPLRGFGPSSSGTLRQLVTSVRSPRGVLDAVVYVCFSTLARVSTTALPAGWERDESSRV
jgi:GT2 family glycosyltransferase